MTIINRRTALAGIGATTAAGTFAKPSLAQAAYPNRQITIVSPAAAGSQSDVFARVLAAPLQQRLGVPVIVENRGGAGGIIGTRAGVSAQPDGYTLVYGSSSGFIIAPQLREPLPYVTPRDLTPIAITLGGPSIITVNAKLPIKTPQELVAYLKANPGKLNLGSHGVGSFSHVAMELFMGETGTQMAHIPFSGGGPLAAAFMSATVDIALFDVLSISPQVEAGTARVVAQVGEQRSPLFANVPLVSETVAPGVRADYWLGLFAPKGTPADIVERLHTETLAIMAQPDNKDRVAKASMLVTPLGLPAVNSKVNREWEDWGRVIRERKLGGIGAAK